jgi:hypothetical protein
VFATIAALADARNGGVAYLGSWIRYDNTGDVPERIRAALDAIATLGRLPGSDRHGLVAKAVTVFAPVENAAEHATPAAKGRNPKVVWDRVRPSVIRLLQRLCGEPKAADGSLLATAAEFEVWFRAHKDPRKAPWAP